MQHELVAAYRDIHETVEEVYSKIDAGVRKTQVVVLDPTLATYPKMQEAVDTLYALKNMEKSLNALRQHISKIVAFFEKCVSQQHAHTLSEEGEMAVRSIKSEYTTATPRYETQVPLPSKRKDPDKFQRVSEWLGIPKELIEAGIYELRWTELKTAYENAIAEGRPLPEGFSMDDVYWKCSVSCRPRRDLLEGELPK